jgi:formate dehydrogenase subunit gamma
MCKGSVAPIMRKTLSAALAAAVVGLALTLVAGGAGGPARAQGSNPNVRPPAGAVSPGAPGVAQPDQPGNYDIEMWKRIRGGLQGQVSIPDKKAGQLVQSEGEAWRNFRNGPLPRYGLWGMGAMIALLALFLAVRGRIRIEEGWAGRTITRFTEIDRLGHWLLAVSFIILALTGLNILYGRYLFLGTWVVPGLGLQLGPLMEPATFATMSATGKWLHNYVAFAFMVGLVLTFVLWIRHNFPSWRDVAWLLKGGGLLVRGSHPPAWKFNAGQKIIFWLVMLGGLSLSLSGLDLLFPFQMAMFSKTFVVLNYLGFNLPTDLTPVQEMQYAASWHGIVSLVLIAVIIAHIYIGTIGMQGAFSAMGSGQVDVNWAKEHHSLWAEQELRKMEEAAAADTGGPRLAPAE